MIKLSSGKKRRRGLEGGSLYSQRGPRSHARHTGHSQVLDPEVRTLLGPGVQLRALAPGNFTGWSESKPSSRNKQKTESRAGSATRVQPVGV